MGVEGFSTNEMFLHALHILGERKYAFPPAADSSPDELLGYVYWHMAEKSGRFKIPEFPPLSEPIPMTPEEADRFRRAYL